MHFKEQKNKFEFKATDEEKRIVTGAAMVPNQEIIRMDAENNPYFVYFTEETILKAQEIFAKYGKTKSTNFEHKTGLRDVTVVESWIVTDPKNDKSNALGFSDIPKGSWFVSYKVDNDKLWEMVKAGEVKGFSIEGVFSKNIVQMSEEVKNDVDNNNDSYSDLFNKISGLFKK